MNGDSQTNTTDDRNTAESLIGQVHWLQHATFWSQIGLGVIGIVALCIYGKQLGVMRTQLRESEEVTRSATMTQIASNMPFISELRFDGVLKLNPANEYVIRLTQTFGQTGETPAANPHAKWGWGRKIGAVYQRDVGAWSNSSWSKGQAPTDEVDVPVSEMQDFARLGGFYVYGMIWYNDVFVDSLHRSNHVSKFCTQVYDISMTERGDVTWRGKTCDDHTNCYDLGCPASDYPR